MELVVNTDYKPLYEAEKAHRQQQEVALAAMRQELDQLRRMIFGSRSERFVPAAAENPAQLILGLDQQVNPAAAAQTRQIAYERQVKTPVTKTENPNLNGRSALPEHLRREEILLQPEHVPHGARKIGEEITEELEYAPGELYVRRSRPPEVRPAFSGRADYCGVYCTTAVAAPGKGDRRPGPAGLDHHQQVCGSYPAEPDDADPGALWLRTGLCDHH